MLHVVKISRYRSLHKFPHFGGASSGSPTSLFPAISGPRLTQPSENCANTSSMLYRGSVPAIRLRQAESATGLSILQSSADFRGNIRPREVQASNSPGTSTGTRRCPVATRSRLGRPDRPDLGNARRKRRRAGADHQSCKRPSQVRKFHKPVRPGGEKGGAFPVDRSAY